MKRHRFVGTLAAFMAASLFFTLAAKAADQTAANIPKGYKLLYQQDFSSEKALKDFVFTDPDAWRFTAVKDRNSMELFGKSKYEAAQRSPFNIAMIADKTFGDFVMEVELASTKEPYKHQDMCLFFGMQDPLKFYYVHMAVAADPHAHNIFIVKDAPRTAIAKKTTKGITWGINEWHKVRLERDTKAGTIKVYFDDFSKPLMLAEDKTFGTGWVGVGSFDDIGKISHIRIWGPKAEEKKIPFYKSK